MRAERGESVTIVDLYELVARRRGVRAEDLAVEERAALSNQALRFVEPSFEILDDTGRADSEPIELVPYDPAWPARFEDWKQRLLTALPTPPRRVEHIGSTAVPGLAAKPIVDILVGVDDLEAEAAYVPAIEGLGVQLRSRDRDHRYFRPFSGRPRDVHVHVCTADSDWERPHLVFRDYLRRNPEARSRYVAVKQAAAARWRYDRVAYTESKTAIIAALTAEAETAGGRG